MDEKWQIKVYESQSGDKPVEEFLNSLDEKARLKVSRTFELCQVPLLGRHHSVTNLA